MSASNDYRGYRKLTYSALILVFTCTILSNCTVNTPTNAISTDVTIPVPSLEIRLTSTPKTELQPTDITSPTSTVEGLNIYPDSLIAIFFRKFFPAVPPGLGKIYNHLIFFSNISGIYQLYQINLDGSDLTLLPQVNDQDVYDMEPAWAPDGRIAFTSTHVDQNWEIFVLYPDRPQATQLTSWGADSWSLTWSPNGKLLAFVSNYSQDEEIYIIPADGGNPINLTQRPDANDFLPVWSPDGQHIMFVSNRVEGVNLDLFVMNIDGSEVTQLTTSEGFDTSPDWSPDGTKIAFVSDRAGNYDVYVMDYPAGTEAKGGTPIRLTQTAEYEWSPTWSPDGKYIAFTSLRDSKDENYQVYTMLSDGSNQVRLTNDAGDDIIPRWWP